MNDPRTQPLHEWNRLARENAENAIVSSMFDAALKAYESIDTFSTWLLVASAAVGSFLIANADKLLPILHQSGFKLCGIALCVSCIFGLLAKIFALRSKIMSETSSAVQATFKEHLAKHKEEARRIKESAEFWGIDIQSGLRLQRILDEFSAPMPGWVRWIAHRHWRKLAGNPQAAYVTRIRTLYSQGLFAFLQAMAFLAFLGAGFISAAT